MKIRRLGGGDILAGFAGSTADALTLFERFEGKLEKYSGNLRRASVELAKDGRSDRTLRRLEAILHPRVRAATERWLKRQRRRRQALVVLDIPLLYETNAGSRCDAVAVVSAPYRVQRARVLRRPGMTEARFREILAQQVPDADKRFLADFVIPTGLGKNHTLRRIRRIVRLLKGRA